MALELCFKPYKGLPADPVAARQVYDDATTALTILNEQLGKTEFVAGKQLTLVDIFLTPLLQYLSVTELGKEMLAKYANIGNWWERISARPAWKRCLAEAQAERELQQ
jgi:glutathione S-transferase